MSSSGRVAAVPANKASIRVSKSRDGTSLPSSSNLNLALHSSGVPPFSLASTIAAWLRRPLAAKRRFVRRSHASKYGRSGLTTITRRDLFPPPARVKKMIVGHVMFCPPDTSPVFDQAWPEDFSARRSDRANVRRVRIRVVTTPRAFSPQARR